MIGLSEQSTSEPLPDDAAAVLKAFRVGDVAAGYELLGRQATIDQWKEVLSTLTGQGADADLERIAGSTLGRQPEVVSSVIDLIEASSTPQALFIAHAITKLRQEAHLVDRARSVELKLADQHQGLLEDADESDGRATLYTLLAQPLPRRKEVWASWCSALPERVASVEHALRAEDERLQRLSKERSYKAGSYLHFLRHSIADLVLVTGVDEKLGKRAFALLQRRVDEADQQEELLAELPDETRKRYLGWTLDLQNADVVPRTRFALRMVRERFTDDADASALLTLCSRGQPAVAVDAALTSIRIGLVSPALDGEVARLITEIDVDEARRLAHALVNAPDRIHLDRIGRDRRALLFETPVAASAEFGYAIVRQLQQLSAPDEVGEVLAALEQVAEGAVPLEVFEVAARELTALDSADPSYRPVVSEALTGERFREGAWLHLVTLEERARHLLGRALIRAELPELRTERALRALEQLDTGAQASFADLMLEEVFVGSLDPSEASASWPVELRGRALERAEEARHLAEREQVETERQIELGGQAYLAELRGCMEPLIERAANRAAGNARLEAGYARLGEALQTPPLDEDSDGVAEAEVPESFVEELSKVGVRLETDEGSIHITLENSPANDAARLRYLGVLDQRAQRSGTSGPVREAAARVLPAYAQALGASGLARRAVGDLFDGGALLPVAVQLSAAARELLLESAVANGLEPSPQWIEHSVLGEWLRAVQLQGDRARPVEGEPPDLAMLATAFRLARDANSRLRAIRDDLDSQRHSVKEQVARVATGVFDEIDALIDSYAQLWHGFSKLGIRQIAPLGLVVAREDLDPNRHQIVGEASADHFLVRSPGVEIDGEVQVRARLEGVHD